MRIKEKKILCGSVFFFDIPLSQVWVGKKPEIWSCVAY